MQVVCESNAPTDVYQDRPVLIIEVLSPSTRRYELDEKMAAYLTIASLEYYLVLEQHQPSAILMKREKSRLLVERHRLFPSGQRRSRFLNSKIVIPANAGIWFFCLGSRLRGNS